MNHDIGFYNKHILCNNSYLKRYLINNIVRYSIDNNIKNNRMNNLIDIYLDNNYYNIKGYGKNKLLSNNLKKSEVTFVDKCYNTINIEKCERSINTVNKIVDEKSTNTCEYLQCNLKSALKKSNPSYNFNNNNNEASIINRIKVNDKLNSYRNSD